MSAKRKPRKNWTFNSSTALWFDESMSLEAIVLWHVLMCYRNKDTGECHPNVYTLGKLARIGRRRVDAAMKELIKAGAVKKRTVSLETGGRFAGKKCYYSVEKIDKWKSRKRIQLTEHTNSERSVAERSVVDQEQFPTVEHFPPVDSSKMNTPRLASGRPLSLTLPETEALLAGLGIGDDVVAAWVFGKLEDRRWLDPDTGLPFPNRENLEAFMARLGEKMETCRTGGA